MHVNDIRVMGRATQGVRVIRLDKKDEIADVAVIGRDEDSTTDDLNDAEDAATGEDLTNN